MELIRDWPPTDTPPEWLTLTDLMMGPSIGAASSLLRSGGPSDPDLQVPASLALRHYAGSMQYLAVANRDGMHTIALGLARHALEALTVVELALPCSGTVGDALLSRWRDKCATLGHIRMALESDVWARYGDGLWDETWAQFFGNLARALQPYAHCSTDLLEWGVTAWADPATGKMLASVGQYDPLKASRITLLQSLLTWTLARLVQLSDGDAGDVQALRAALARSTLLFEAQSDWSLQFTPHMFFKSP